MDHPRAIFIASTGQHVGKTTASLGILSGLLKRLPKVGFMKPVGQESVETEAGVSVDKDVILVKEHFGLDSSYQEMSPVLLPQGFTRNYLDGKVDSKALKHRIETSFQSIAAKHDFTLVEGTGHVGVGSIVNLNNAQVAALLKIPIVFIAPGGLGSSFDELELNRTLCEKYGVPVAGVILNRVLPDKRGMILEYMAKGLSRWGIPILGCIPYDPLLSNPSMQDFEQLFKTRLMSGEKHKMSHFQKTRLVDTSVDAYRNLIDKSQLIITPANREDIILATLKKYWEMKVSGADLEAGMILTGDDPPTKAIVEQIQQSDIPMLYASVGSFMAMKMITSFVAKIRKEDVPKVQEAIGIVEEHIDFTFFDNPFLPF